MTLTFPYCTLTIEYQRCTVTFPDGKICVGATGLDQPGQKESAEAMGYDLTEDGLHRMLHEHELCHVLVCQQLGMPYSMVHRMLAEKGQGNLSPVEVEYCKWEEMLAGSFQVFCNTSARHGPLQYIPVNPYNLRKKFLKLKQKHLL